MKKYILFLAAAVIASACTEKAGTEPGNDPEPKVTVYQYEVSTPYNPDNDVIVRVAANSKTEEAYYLAELTSDKESRVASLGEDGYMDYVVSNGTKIDGISGASTEDLVLTDIVGAYTITIVAVGDSKKTSSAFEFVGLEWEDVVSGTYYMYACSAFNKAKRSTTLQKCTTDDTLYRFKEVFGEGYSMKINLLPDYTATDSGGDTYTFFRVPKTSTPWSYGSYGSIGVRDVGYWQGNSSYVTDYGYESGMYADYTCFLCVQYFVSAGNIGYGYDYFYPAE